ncbi:RNI-like protein [Epithele typhae]|uniref:RNI-like protein n=1 Tax=Epithele typhae TaxID=378194 RepID=UPI002008763B|nr:RNI-like protein [Epithele typhae]KAH9932005.1 RNI-like protein [Epithele typhae]
MAVPMSVSPQTAGPSSYGSGFVSISTDSTRSIRRSDATPPVSPAAEASPSAEVAHVARRPRSLSSLRSTRSLSAVSVRKMKTRLVTNKAPGTIARKLLFKRRTDSSSSDDAGAIRSPSARRVVDTEAHGGVELGRGSCFMPWARDLKACTSPPQGTLVDIDVGLVTPLTPVSPIYRIGQPAGTLRTKGRSYSSPFPLPTAATDTVGASPLDVVPLAPADISEPIIVNIPDYFDEWLPRELRLRVLVAFVDLYDEEHAEMVAGTKWSAGRAGQSRNRWVGREKGIRELLKLSRVCKAWQSLVYDGQLWARLPRLLTSVLTRLCDTAGGFVKRIDFTGLAELTSDMLIEMTDALCSHSTVPSGLQHTHITKIDLYGCNAISSRALHYLLIRAPALQSLCIKGLPAVNSNTCSVLSTYCRKLRILDMSRCANVNGDGIRALAESALDRGEMLPLTVLRLNGLTRVSDGMMFALGRAAPLLEVLDLSCATALHNSSIEAFVTLSAAEALPPPIQTPVTRLRHLALSGCPLLTDHALSHLAHAVPALELLELAGVGPDLRDDGLIRLFGTTPRLRKVDLEDATEITDAVLAALTPVEEDASVAPPPRRSPRAPQTGDVLEHLTVSYAGHLTNDAFLALVRGCTRLRVLEADNTRLSSAALREFVMLSRARTVRRGAEPSSVVVAIDCRGVGEVVVRDLAAAGHTRPRDGWRSFEARRLAFADARDEDARAVLDASVGEDECDATRVVVKTFYSWQTVDAVRAAREKRRKARRAANGSASSTGESSAPGASARARWWSPGARRAGGASPVALEGMDRDGCTIM